MRMISIDIQLATIGPLARGSAHTSTQGFSVHDDHTRYGRNVTNPPPTVNELPSRPVYELPSPQSSYNNKPCSIYPKLIATFSSPVPSYSTSTPMNTEPTQDFEFQLSAGHCFTCAKRSPNRIQHVKINQNNPNSGRPYRKCTNRACSESNGFNGFTDDRGINSWNPLCHCQIRSRLIAKKSRNRSTGLRETFFSCQDKGCKFVRPYKDENGNVKGFTDSKMERMIRRGEI
jgi:hypothetical protein